MKIKTFLLVVMSLSIPFISTFGQEDGSEVFNTLRDAILPSLPEGFVVNTGQTSDSRFNYRITYDENGDETNRLIYLLDPNSMEFTEMDIAMEGKNYSWKDREVLFSDGSETGMSGIKVLLLNGAGKFTLTHRDFKTFKPMNKEDLEKMLEVISLEKLENQ